MKKFIAKVEIPGKEPKYIPDAVIYNGKLAQCYLKGVGEPHTVGGMFNGEGDVWDEYDKYVETYRPFINSSLLAENGLTMAEVKAVLDKDQMLAFTDERISKCLFVMGDNPNGYRVIDQSAIDEQQRAENSVKVDESYKNKTAVINFIDGVFGFTLAQRLPAYIWALTKPFATYHEGDDEDIEWADDMGIMVDPSSLRGWFYTEGALNALLNSGYKVSYHNSEIQSVKELPGVKAKIKAKEAADYKAYCMFRSDRNNLLQKFRNLYTSGEYMQESDCDKILSLTEIHFENLDITGANIYGGGFWMHSDDKYLYLVQNNGMDGDDWSRNNYRTGGAGAICMRVPLTNSVAALLKRACDFEKKTVEDYIGQ